MGLAIAINALVDVYSKYGAGRTWRDRYANRFSPTTKEIAAMIRKSIGALLNHNRISLGGTQAS